MNQDSEANTFYFKLSSASPNCQGDSNESADTTGCLNGQSNVYVNNIRQGEQDGFLGPLQDKAWLLAAFTAMVFIGFAAFINGVISDKGVVAKNIGCFGYLGTSMAYMIFCFARNYRSKGQIWSIQNNDWIKTNKYGEVTIEWDKIIGLLGASIGTIIGTYFISLSYSTSLPAGVNQGVISTLSVLSAVFSALFTYAFLYESIGSVDLVGMVLVMICAISLSFSQDPDAVVVNIPQDQLTSAIWPVLCAVISSIGFGIRSVFLKYNVREGYNLYNFAFQTLFIDGLVSFMYLLYQMATTELVTSDLFLPGIVYGTLISMGYLFANYAINAGLAGPASAIVNCCAIIQTVLAYFILGQTLNSFQILGFAFGISGAMTFALGDYAILYAKTFVMKG